MNEEIKTESRVQTTTTLSMSKEDFAESVRDFLNKKNISIPEGSYTVRLVDPMYRPLSPVRGQEMPEGPYLVLTWTANS